MQVKLAGGFEFAVTHEQYVAITFRKSTITYHIFIPRQQEPGPHCHVTVCTISSV